MKKLKTIDLVTISLIAAILCILAPVSIPLAFSPVPVTLGLFVVILAGIILGRRKGTLCVLVYLLLGAVGLPIFSNYTGGIQKIAGPTGGYLMGYLLLAWVTGFFVEKFSGRIAFYFLGSVLGVVICYGFGTLWMGMQLKMGPMEALWAGVIPFIPFDLIKIVAAVLVCYPVRKTLIQQNLITVSDGTV